MAAYVQAHHPKVHLWSPQLPPSPQAALQCIALGTADWPQHGRAVVGSSLGGYYASAVAQQWCCRSAMINPAVFPARDLTRYIGEQTHWHDPSERFFFAPAYIAELEAMDCRHMPPAGPELLIAAQGDEVLDWREMLARYPHAQLRLVPGSNHALTDFDQHISALIAFLMLAE